MQLLHTRYSALKLGEPAPSGEAVRAMLESAARVPDHGRLLPWRLVLVEGDARLGLGEVLAEAQGLGAMWKTGDAAYDNTVNSALGIEPDDLIVGFIHVGTDIGSRGTRPQRSIEEFARHWNGAAAR